MTQEELQTAVKELEALANTGKNYVHTETQARLLLANEDIINQPEIHSKVLLILSQSLVQRGLAQEAMPLAEEALRLTVESADKREEAKALGTIGSIYQSFSNYAQALHFFSKALSLNEALSNKQGVAAIFGNIGNVYRNLSDNQRALECYGKALNIHEELGNKKGCTGIMNNIGNVHYNIAEYTHALQFYLNALAINEEIDNKAWIIINLGNIGNVYNRLSDYINALEYYGKALAISDELGDKKTSAGIMNNIGNVHRNINEYSLALQFYLKALAINEEIDNKQWISVNLGNIGSIYTYQDYDGYDAVKAEELLCQAIALSKDIGNKDALINQYSNLCYLYESQKRWEDAYISYKKYIEIEKEINIEEVKKQESIRKQQKEIEIERMRATAEKHLLNNILPEEITQRLIKGESPIADHFDGVSIVFMDIVNFTVLSSKITAQQLVYLLNAIFKTADAVMREFGLEKIKTIGDAYMAVAGAPIIQKDHALRAAQASLALLSAVKNIVVEFPEELGDRSWMDSIPEIQVRIGLHCGSAAAGVVGENKFLYDLWGDAVNTAARMESHGEAGKIHVSEEFVNQLTMDNGKWKMKQDAEKILLSIDNYQLSIIPRGEIEIKGKGKMRTYFLERR